MQKARTEIYTTASDGRLPAVRCYTGFGGSVLSIRNEATMCFYALYEITEATNCASGPGS